MPFFTAPLRHYHQSRRCLPFCIFAPNSAWATPWELDPIIPRLSQRGSSSRCSATGSALGKPRRRSDIPHRRHLNPLRPAILRDATFRRIMNTRPHRRHAQEEIAHQVAQRLHELQDPAHQSEQPPLQTKKHDIHTSNSATKPALPARTAPRGPGQQRNAHTAPSPHASLTGTSCPHALTIQIPPPPPRH